MAPTTNDGPGAFRRITAPHGGESDPHASRPVAAEGWRVGAFLGQESDRCLGYRCPVSHFFRPKHHTDWLLETEFRRSFGLHTGA